jgi:S1-C subfamily serine protease
MGDRPEDSDEPLRGWIDPDDRLWRHPSEVAGARPGPLRARPGVAVDAGSPRARLMLLIGAGAVVVAVAWLVILLSPGSDHPPPTSSNEVAADAPLTTLAAQGSALPAAAEAAGHSMVELEVTTSHGTVSLVGVAVAEGGLVATTADALSGLRSISMVGPGGRLLRSSVVAEDHDSDLALVNVPDDIPVPTFADDTALSAGTADMTLSLAASTAAPPTVHCLTGSVTAVGTAISAGPARGMPAITSSAPDAVGQSGDPLLNLDGDVIGLLDAGPGAGSASTFLPAQLVLGVTDDLRSDDRVVHGWLGVGGSNGPDASGAVVAAFKSNSPAVGHLQAGEEIVGVDAAPVRTMAELRARLYVLAPGTTVALSVVDGSVSRVVDVTLSGSP